MIKSFPALLVFCVSGFIFLPNLCHSQAPGRPSIVPKKTASDYIHILGADELAYSLIGADTIQRLVGDVRLNQDTVFLYCDSAIILNSTRVSAKGRFILQHGKSTTIFADSATYRGDTKIADLFVNVSLLRGNQKLFTDLLSYNTTTKIATYLTGATLTDDTTHLTSIKGYYHADTDDIFFKDSVVVVSPDFTLKTDTMKFNASRKVATFLGPTLIVQDTAKIYTEAGFYDINKKKAEFTKNPQYVKNTQKAWAELMAYDGHLSEVTLIGNAHSEDTSSVANAHLIRYNEKTEVTFLAGNAFIQDKDRTITGDSVTYDARNETYSTRGRSHILDGSQVLDADMVDYDKTKEIGIARGNVIWQDTTEHLTVVCEFAEHSKKKNYLKASGGKLGRPLLIKEVDNDSLYVVADTLLSFRPEEISKERQDTLQVAQPDTSAVTTTKPADEKPDSTRTILAYHDVRIFKSDLQAVCDSLAYSTLDSMFRLYNHPVVWSDTSQFKADTVLMQLANDKIDRIFLRNESFIVNSPDEIFFNQIKGKNSIAFFEEGEIRRVRVEGNAESVYYALDDEDAYIGVNKTVCSEMMIFFGNNEVEGIRFYADPKATLFPMKKADHEGLKMPGFSWEIKRRPQSVDDLFK